MQGAQLTLAHQARDAVLTAGLAGLPQVQEDARGAVDALTRRERRTDQAEQPGIFLGPARGRVREPLVVSARGHAEDATHGLHTVPVSMGLMNAYVDRTRPVLSFVDIGIALRDYPGATVHQVLGTPISHCGDRWASRLTPTVTR